MKLNKPINSNYAAVIAKVDNIVTLDNCDNVQGAIVLGNHIIVQKDVQIGDLGVYFPLECALSHEYMHNNNLYNKYELNKDTTKKAYFDKNGRVRAQNFRGHKSEGLFMSLDSLKFTGVDIDELELYDEFDEMLGNNICSKYVVKQKLTQSQGNGKRRNKSYNKVKKLIETQFRFHSNTNQLYRNLHKITPESLIQITKKLHGTSGISSYVLCNRNITRREKFGELLHKFYTYVTTLGKINYIQNKTEYDYIYSSRKVVKNNDLNPNAQHFYNVDVWGLAHEKVKPFLKKGMSFYYEIVGYLPSGKMIQKDYDYGYTENTFGIYIYRITQTSIDGDVFEFSGRQVQEFCKKNGLNAVPELFYGHASELSDERMTVENWQNKFHDTVKERYNDKPCDMCVNNVPEEGVVIRLEDNLEFEAYKQKSYKFYEYESKQLDSGEVNIEDEEE